MNPIQNDFSSVWHEYIQPNLSLLVSILVACIAWRITWRLGHYQIDIARQQAETSRQQAEIAGGQAETASRQAETARNRLKFDLFERRESVYKKIRLHIEASLNLPVGVYYDPGLFYDEVREVKWLFDPEVSNWIHGELKTAFHNLVEIRQIYKDFPHPGPAQVALMDAPVVEMGTRQLNEIVASRHLAARAQFDKLDDLMRHYLTLAH